MRNESAADFWAREQLMRDWIGPRQEWADRDVMDVAHALEALGVAPDGFSRLLALTDEVGPCHRPAGLCDLARGYRFGVSDRADGSSGEPMGVYRGVVILAWATS
jgi:hypothetical protein